MALIVYNKENSRPQEVTYKGKRTINLDSRGTVYLSKTMSIELGILGGGRVNFAHDDETGDWYICRADDNEGFIVWKDKRCARFSAGFIVHRLMQQAGWKEKRTVHDGKDTDGSRRSRLLQDTAFQSYSQIINGLKNRCITGYPAGKVGYPFSHGRKLKNCPDRIYPYRPVSLTFQ